MLAVVLRVTSVCVGLDRRSSLELCLGRFYREEEGLLESSGFVEAYVHGRLDRAAVVAVVIVAWLTYGTFR
ncbi:MAG TPA: hypothetical protein VG734_01655 [Lacunisphaera sp.]|nr:hypothetical protein [Lacunisphaera sp.]